MTPLLILTDRRQAARPLVDVVGATVDGGARWIVLREKDLPRAERAALAEALRPIVTYVGGRLIVAGPDPLRGPAAPPLGEDRSSHADAVHLPAVGPYPPPAPPAFVGRSCHDETELARLSTEDYVTLSPVFVTLSKPGYVPPLGLPGLARLVARTSKPVFALGGVGSAAQAVACLEAGAAGVAVMGAVMRADDPAAVVAGLLGALERR